MTPLEISILLHYHWSAEDFRSGDFSAPAVRGAIDDFLRLEALESQPDRERCYQLGERGRVYVAALMALELPEKRWVMRGQG